MGRAGGATTRICVLSKILLQFDTSSDSDMPLSSSLPCDRE